MVLLTYCIFFFNVPPTPVTYTLSLHDALPISRDGAARSLDEPPAARAPRARAADRGPKRRRLPDGRGRRRRSEEHTSELQSRRDLVCRLLLEKKKLLSAAF